MREILFRGKRKEDGEWAEGYFVYAKSDFDDETLREADIIPHDTDRVYKGEYNVVYPCIPETIGQYTGLTDKNGTKIFEGDICQHRSYYSDNIVISVVTYTDGQFLAMADENSGFNLSNKLEVIGNIHDNPELLRTPQNDEVRE